MRTFVMSLLAACALVGAAVAHPATEQFIPIGQSPGADTVQGEVSVVAEPSAEGEEPTFSVNDGEQVWTYAIGPRTRIYVDRSEQGEANTMGAIADLQAGHVVEVRLEAPDSRYAAWVKVRP